MALAFFFLFCLVSFSMQDWDYFLYTSCLRTKRASDALGESWQATDEVGTKLFVLTSVFLGIQVIFGLVGGLVGIDSSIGFLVLATLIKYATMMPLFYLFFSLYQSLERTQ